MTVQEAIKHLRGSLGLTQEGLARHMALTVRTIARYEGDGPPKGQALKRFADLALESGDAKAETVFTEALEAEYQDGETQFGNQLFKGIVLTLFKNGGEPWLSAELQKLIAKAERGAVLVHPQILNADGTKCHSAQVEYLKELKAELKQLRKPAAARTHERGNAK